MWSLQFSCRCPSGTTCWPLSVGRGPTDNPSSCKTGAGVWDSPAASSHCNGGKGLAVPDTWAKCQVVHGRESRRTCKNGNCQKQTWQLVAKSRRAGPRRCKGYPPRGAQYLRASLGEAKSTRPTRRPRKPNPKRPNEGQKGGRGTNLWGGAVEGFPP